MKVPVIKIKEINKVNINLIMAIKTFVIGYRYAIIKKTNKER